MKTIFLYIFITYISLFLVALFFSDSMIFLPPKSGYKSTQGLIKLLTSDGNIIYAYYLPNKNAKYTLLVSHGNAEDIGYMLPLLQFMQTQGFSVLAYDYHGYGLSSGKPSEKTAYLDVKAAYDFLTKDLNVSPDRIIAFGHSVGAAVALDLAIREPVAAVILQGTFISAFRVMTVIPIFPFDKFENIKKIGKLNCPLLMIHGTADGIIPFWHGQKLYELATVPRQFYAVKNAGHNNIFAVGGQEYWDVIKNFVKQYLDK